MARAKAAVKVPGGISTSHRLILGDSRRMPEVSSETAGLIVTSPPYWTLKDYPENLDQLGGLEEYQAFQRELARVWEECFRVLLPGGRLCIVVGDVCLSRRKHGSHRVIPLHADILHFARNAGFDALTPIFWLKRTNMKTEMVRSGSYFLGKPFQPNGIIKNDVEYVLLLRKPGDYRKPTEEQRRLSVIPKEDRHSQGGCPKEEYVKWYRSVWSDITGASTRDHPAPYPVEIARRLVRMFSFVGDTVLDPFVGTGSTLLAAKEWGRHSVGYDIEEEYLALAHNRLAELHVEPEARVESFVRAGLKVAV